MRGFGTVAQMPLDVAADAGGGFVVVAPRRQVECDEALGETEDESAVRGARGPDREAGFVVHVWKRKRRLAQNGGRRQARRTRTMENSMSTLSAGVLLFLIMDPLGNIPLFLSLLRNVDPKRRQLVLVRELLIALVVLFVFLFGGTYLLRVLQLKQESVSIAGGIVLFLIGVRMVFPPKEGIFGGDAEREPFIVPMAIPGIAGPSAVAAVMLLANSSPGRTVDWSVALSLAWLATAVILLSSTYLFRYLGTSVLVAVERLMGMLLVALSVQMFLDGVMSYVKLAS
jgi:MarC family membrane protein